ncbi:hypothetical protein BU16DRAFT_238806 [Lophium mytilinum]|uniref:Uncharacterized protein n=1 Tax=Lophium mytilinum TaxID=390894 RepID=A0A6A6R6H3_9PEZI|nr:hypothetical protein BU16DRAFT_238806 [Lophium mytilinum]
MPFLFPFLPTPSTRSLPRSSAPSPPSSHTRLPARTSCGAVCLSCCAPACLSTLEVAARYRSASVNQEKPRVAPETCINNTRRSCRSDPPALEAQARETPKRLCRPRRIATADTQVLALCQTTTLAPNHNNNTSATRSHLARAPYDRRPEYAIICKLAGPDVHCLRYAALRPCVFQDSSWPPPCIPPAVPPTSRTLLTVPPADP